MNNKTFINPICNHIHKYSLLLFTAALFLFYSRFSENRKQYFIVNKHQCHITLTVKN